MTGRLVEACHRFNAAHPWDHNARYHRWILRQLPPQPDRVLDIGCGTGDFARKLAQRAAVVDAVDSDARVIRIATAESEGTSVTYHLGDALDCSLDPGYAVITCLAALHHLPFTTAVEHWRGLLAPGGTLVVLGTYRETTAVDRLLSLVAVAANLAVGGWRAVRAGSAPTARPVAMTASTRPPTLSLPQIRRLSAAGLPGARIRRRLFWRYTLVYRAAG